MKISSFFENSQAEKLYLIENPLNIRYFTGTSIDTGYLVFADKKAFFITDFRYIEVAEKYFEKSEVEVILLTKLSEILKNIFEENNCTALVVEAEFQTFSRMKFFKTVTENVITDGSLDKIISDLRVIKTVNEVEKIKKAQEITDASFEHILKFIKPGVTEKDIALEIEFFMRKNGAEGVSFDLISISGKNTSLPHGVPSLKKIENGDFVTMDIGCKVDGYCSDMTRTVAVGYASDEMKSVYNTVLEAQLKALDTIKSGVRASEVDNTARSIINAAGYEGCFGHATGHGVGLFIHESPRVSENSVATLKPGMVITVEPGIYLKNKFGVRTEDMVVVTENGCNNLTKSPKELIIL